MKILQKRTARKRFLTRGNFRLFDVKDYFFLSWEKIKKTLTWKKISLPWKFSNFRAWKIKNYAWNFWKKPCVKTVSLREIFEKNRAWRPFPCVKKMKKMPKIGFTQGFNLHAQKKNTVQRVNKSQPDLNQQSWWGTINVVGSLSTSDFASGFLLLFFLRETHNSAWKPFLELSP